MKKIINVLLALAVFAGAFMLSGCGEGADEFISHTYNVWYKYNNEVDVPVANADSSDSSKDGVLKGSKVYVKYNPSNGLTVLVCTTKTQEISYLGGAYTVQADVTTGGSKIYPPEEFGRGKWTSLMLLGKFVKEEPPAITVNLDDIMGGQFNLKRILTEFLINTLLAE